MASCVIMQPTYMPWAGYFNLLTMADHFVFYDDADFSKGSWHNRNRLISNGEPLWLTVPVYQHLHQKITDVTPIYSSCWKDKHVKTIRNIYARHEFFYDLNPVVDILSSLSDESLAEINIKIIQFFIKALDITCTVQRSSRLMVGGGRSDKLHAMCRELNCETYISPAGAMEYIESDAVLKSNGIEVIYQKFTPAVYKQKCDTFIPYMSIIDVVACIGLDACKKYIRGGYEI